ncbi:Cytochrome c biogenesis protein CcsA [bioreactor metagenome]|uniref:Cytochrome c biogenesis protein CcsA n=1 Tax=bioreactor metagenome TaxID=1076179 RepID=A0A644TQE9_9ZZZZ|nr:c-type cytochrome biogenesis protein CcsB [Negativicutes bacterium]
MAEYEAQLFNLAFFSYFAASCMYIGYLVMLNDKLALLGRIASIIGVGFNTLAIIARTMKAGHLPFANMYEFGMVLVWGLVIIHFVIEYQSKRKALGAFVLPLAFVLAGVFALFYQEARPLVPALKSNWLLIHVVMAVFAYGALAASCAIAATYFLKHRLEKNGDDGPLSAVLPELESLENMVNQLIALAMPFMTLLILTGAVWAEYAWGSYWRWDPKETWSLITWLVYAIYLHGRSVLGWRGNRAMTWAIVGFITVLFTFIGVNVLLPGLHSYAF